MKKNHYIVGKIRTEEAFKLFLGKVTSIDGQVLSGYVEKLSHIPSLRASFEVLERDVVVDLGPKPHPGTVHKFDTSHLWTGHRKPHPFFGDIHFFYRPDKEVGSKLMQAFDRAASILEKAKLPAPEGTLWEVNPKETKGKYSGMYIHSKKPTKLPHRFQIKPESMPVTITDFVYVILHEYMHWLHRHCVTGIKVNAAWIRLFNTSIKPQTVDKDLSRRLLDDLVRGGERPSDFKTSLDEGDKNAFNWIVRTISQEHAVGLRELDLLFEADEKDELKQLWPKRTLHKKDLAPIVSEYATKNYHELLAEAFAFYFTKRQLPKNVTTLLEKTLEVARRTPVPDQATDEE